LQILLRLAEVYGKAGQAEDGLHVLAEALAAVSKGGERRFEAEFYRLQGELRLQSGVRRPEAGVFNAPLGEAETCFRRAIDVARSQHAKSLELRAAMSLSRLWQQQGKRQEARCLLEPIYGWFTEGFDTPDLQEAKALLEALQ
jgi:predicted ATPase